MTRYLGSITFRLVQDVQLLFIAKEHLIVDL